MLCPALRADNHKHTNLLALNLDKIFRKREFPLIFIETMIEEKKHLKHIGFWSLVFLVGGIAGVIFGQLIIPWLADFRPFSAISWFNRSKDGTTIINRTEKIYLTQEQAYQKAVDKISGSVVAVRNISSGRAGSGFILTSDGLIATAGFLAPKGAKVVVLKDSQEYEAQLIKQDKENGLALVKINENNLPMVSFGDADNLKLGEMVFLAGAVKTGETFNKFINSGFIKMLAPQISLTFNADQAANGGVLGNIAGEVLGLCLVDKNGNIKLIEAERIKELMKL